MHWTHFEEPASTFALAALPAGGCLAATAQGLWQLGLRRKAWTTAAPQFAQVPLTAVAAHGSTWLIGSNGDIAVSRDGGAMWGIATLPVKAHVVGLAMSCAFDRDGIALAATARDGVLRTADSGTTWHAWNYGLLDLGINALALSTRFDEDTTCFAATDYAVFMSTNGGRAWQEVGAPAGAKPFTALAVLATRRGATLNVGTEGNGLWSAAEPYEVWERVKGFRADEVNFLSSGFAATTAGIYGADGGKWAKLSDAGDAVCLAVLSDHTVMAGTAGGGMWHGTP